MGFHPALLDPGEDVAGQRIGQIIDIAIFRQVRCGKSREGHRVRKIGPSGSERSICMKCALVLRTS